MRKYLFVVATMAVPFFSSFAAEAPGQTGEISRKVVETYEIPGTDEEVRMILAEFPPGAASPKHFHPVVGLNYIIEGTAESQYEGEAIKVFKAGDSYQDEAFKEHLIFRNPSRTLPLKFLIACKIKKGLPFMEPSKAATPGSTPSSPPPRMKRGS